MLGQVACTDDASPPATDIPNEDDLEAHSPSPVALAGLTFPTEATDNAEPPAGYDGTRLSAALRAPRRSNANSDAVGPGGFHAGHAQGSG